MTLLPLHLVVNWQVFTILSMLKVKNLELCFCEDGLLRLADPSFVDACQQHITSRYYNCDIDIANDPEIVNNRAWLACPTYIGTSECRRIFAVFYGSRRARTSGPILTIYTSYDVFPPKDVPFGGLGHTAPHSGGKIPKKPIFAA